MSDYLWDKTGEPDADVEQLENLLGTLKYRPRPMEIPASAMPTGKATRPATIFFSRPRLAVAASLLLMLLAGVWLVTRQGESQRNQIAAGNNGKETLESKATENAVNPVVSDDKTASKVSDDNVKVDNTVDNTVASTLREGTTVAVKAAVHDERRRAPRRLMAKRQKSQPRRGVENAPRELLASNDGMRWEVEEPLTPEQRKATEQLMLALRVASAKFNYAQREMREIGRAGK